jgi:hypothetical protein
VAKYGTFKYGDARYGTGSAGPAFHLGGGGDITVHGQVGGAATLSGGGDITAHGQVGGSATLSGGGDFTDFIGKVGRTWGGYPGSEIDTDQPLLIRFEPGAGGEALTFPAPNDLRFDTEFPGGFKSLSCTIAFPAGVATPPSLTAYAQVRVVDRRTGSTIWYGQLTEPGLSVDAGQTYAVTAEGPQTATDGWREVYGLVDRDSGSWQPVGDFEPAQQSFSGSPFPGGDYPTDYPGYDVDPGDANFDTGDFTGADYPPTADYPGYLGWMQDPFSGVGASLPIPGVPGGLPLSGADTDEWPGPWVPGVTAPGGSAIIASGWARLTSGSAANAYTARRWARPIWSIAGGGDYGWWLNGEMDCRFRLVDSQATVRFWAFGDPTLTQSGVFLDVDTSGTVKFGARFGGVDFFYPAAAAAMAISAGVEYSMLASVTGNPATNYLASAQWLIWQTSLGVGTAVTVGAVQDVSYGPPFQYGHQVDFGYPPNMSWPLAEIVLTHETGFTVPDWDYLWDKPYSDSFFGIGIKGDGVATPRAAEFRQFAVQRHFEPAALTTVQDAYLNSIGYTGPRGWLL